MYNKIIMKENLKKILGKRIKIVSQLTLALLCAVAIIYFMPRNNVFNYNYSESAPWNYGQIIATFDFPIYKSEKRITEEKDSITKNFELYFSKDSTIAVNSLRNLKNRFYSVSNESALRGAYIKYYNVLIKLYQDGIVSSNDKEILNNNLASSINIINGNIVSSTEKSNLRTTAEAYKLLVAADTFPAKAIEELKLNDFIHPNIIYDSEKSKELLEEELNTLPISEGIVQKGQKIVSRGDIVNAETYKILKSYQFETDKRQDNNYKTTTMLLGQIIFVIIAFSMLLSYIYIYNPDIKNSNNKNLVNCKLRSAKYLCCTVSYGHNECFDLFISKKRELRF